MYTLSMGGWIFYLATNDIKELETDNCGKWMYFFNDVDFASSICKKAIEAGVVKQCKHSDNSEGVCCFYLSGDDINAHKRVIQFFLDNDLIRRTKTGKLYNISFKYDDQTDAGEYGAGFTAEIKLDQFLDLNTGEWKV